MTESPAVPTRRRRVASVVWALLPLFYGFPAPFTFAFAAWRLRSRAVAFEAGAYGAVFVGGVVLVNIKGAPAILGGLVIIAVALAATARGFMLRRRVFLVRKPQGAAVDGSAKPTDWALASPGSTREAVDPHNPATPASWTPAFPGSELEPVDPHNPATWRVAPACTGDDGHLLSIPARRALGSTVLGAALLVVDLHFHLTGNTLVVAIALIAAPLFAVLFSRRVDGETLTYRIWGVSQSISLRDVTAVETGKGRSALAFTVAGRRRPLRLSLLGLAGASGDPARSHLDGWLRRPGVRISPVADALLRNARSGVGPEVSRRRRGVRRAIAVIAPLLVVGAVAVQFFLPAGASTGIAGAPGYGTMTGPDGHPLIVGRPWGMVCAPVVVVLPRAIPRWIENQVDGVVFAARRAGVDVTVETPQGTWFPGDLYPSGLSPASVEFVPLALSAQHPRILADGDLEHVEIGWNANDSPTARNATLTALSGTLYTQAIGHDAFTLRRALRQVIAASQGVLTTTVTDSGIWDRRHVDSFTARDLAAMRIMSGCRT